MKKFLAILLITMLVLSMAACGNGTPSGDTSASTGEATSPSASTGGLTAGDVSSGETIGGGAGGSVEGGVLDVYTAGTPWPELPADGPEVNIKISHVNSELQECQFTSVKIKEYLYERSGGKINVTVYPNGQLGSDIETFESLRLGDIEMVWQTIVPQSNFIPELSAFDLPMYYQDPYLLFEKLQSGDLRDYLQGLYRKSGIELMAMYPYGYRTLTSNKEIHTLEDFKGLNIRTMENPYHMQFWRNWGANPTPLAWGEVYIALQQGLLDAQENPIDPLIASKIYEVQDYLYNTNHIVFLPTIIMNEEFYTSLPAEYQALIKITVADAVYESFQQWEALEQEQFKQLQEFGMEYIELSDEVIAQLAELCKPVHEELFAQVGPEVEAVVRGAFE